MANHNKPNHAPESAPHNAEIKQNFHSIKLKYVKLGYHYLISNAIYLLIIPFLAANAVHLTTVNLQDVLQLCNHHIKYNLVTVVSCTSMMAALTTMYILSQPKKVYMVDFACYKPPPSKMWSSERIMKNVRRYFKSEDAAFMKRILERAGMGNKAYLPDAFATLPPKNPFTGGREEVEEVVTGAIDDLLAKTGVKPREIGILIVNISIYNPTPSTCAMIINHYKLRGDILSYNLGGMGCSAGLISIDLAKRLLEVQPNTYALVMSMESVTPCYYGGNDRSKLIPNCLFRMGGAAILLSNRSSDRKRSKYQLIHTIRTHKGADDRAYRCVFQEEDKEGYIGVTLSKDLMVVAGDALKTNITTLGPLVLPLSEQLMFFVTLVARKVFKMKVKPYVPDFKLAFEHFCIHAGGRGVLDAIEQNLKLTQWDMEPSRMSLYRFGNTSSSSLWYELAYCEAKGRVRKGDRVWQIGFGSGFKCNSGVWRALKTINPAKEHNPWTDEVNDFPVYVPETISINC